MYIRHKYVEVFLSWSNSEMRWSLFTLILSSVRVPVGYVMSLSLHKFVMFVHYVCLRSLAERTHCARELPLERAFNTLRPRQNGHHFPDNIFKYIFLNENVQISIKISLKFVSMGSINNIPALNQIMAWPRSGDKPLIIWTNDGQGYRRIYASRGVNELIFMLLKRNVMYWSFNVHVI